jgi:hypothetical protein
LIGWSVGCWDGDTLVVDVTSFNDALHVVESYTPHGPNILDYEATVEEGFSRPWKISMPLYRHVEKNTCGNITAFPMRRRSYTAIFGIGKEVREDTSSGPARM